MTRLLWDALGDVPDRRGRQDRQYELRSVLGIVLAAMLAVTRSASRACR
jgi:hypothetical protein